MTEHSGAATAVSWRLQDHRTRLAVSHAREAMHPAMWRRGDHSNEMCDDGNTVSGEWLLSHCRLRIGYTCSGQPQRLHQDHYATASRRGGGLRRRQHHALCMAVPRIVSSNPLRPVASCNRSAATASLFRPSSGDDRQRH